MQIISIKINRIDITWISVNDWWNINKNQNHSVFLKIYFLKKDHFFSILYIPEWFLLYLFIIKIWIQRFEKKKNKRNEKVNSHLSIAFLISFLFFFLTLEEVSSASRGSNTLSEILEPLNTAETSFKSLSSLYVFVCFFEGPAAT